GDRNWASTYQAVPRTIDELLAKKGATRFSDRGEGDVSGDFEEEFSAWKSAMWKSVLNTFGLKVKENLERKQASLSLP
ncbi:hypothetical protein KZ287_33640, partial [Escherichia coli]|nr:hypothetical protein [Escherichia coli]